MKGNRLKIFGFALLGGLALLFAGCGQQAAPPPSQEPTTVAVEGLYSYTTNNPVDLNNVAGNVIVRAKVALGSVVPEKVQFLLDDNVEYEVAFGAATQGVRPQQATYTFEWNLNTAALNNLAPKYLNGPHTVKVRLVKGNEVVATTTATNVRFNNSDFAIFKMSGNAINKGGKRYYGGGDVSVEVVPVLYSGKTVASVKLDMSAGGVDLDPNTPGTQGSKTLTSAPYVFVIPYAANKNLPSLQGNVGTSSPYTYFTITYSDTTTLSSGSGYIVLDGAQVLADTTGLLSNNPPFRFQDLRLDYYVASVTGGAIACKGSTLLTTGQFANSGNARVGLSFLTQDVGVGGDTLVVDIKTTLGQTLLSDVAVPLSGSGCAGAGAVAGLSEGGFYVVYAKAVKDALGNTRTISPASQSVAFGIDDTKPTLALKNGWDNRVYFNSGSLATNNLAGADLQGNAISDPADVTTLANVNDPASGTPPVASGVTSYSWTVNGQTVLAAPNTPYTGLAIPGLDNIQTTLNQASPTQGYYTLTVQAVDAAGNASDPLTLNVLYDNTAPNVIFTQPTVTALTGGTSFTATARGTDNVDLRQGRIYWSYGTTIRFEAFRSAVKDFGTPAVTSQDYTATLTAITPSSGNFSLFAWVQDQARNALATASLGPLTVTPANANTAGNVSSVTETPSISASSGGSTTLQISHSGGTANVVAVKVYRKNPGITLGGYTYYDYLGDATSLGGGNYGIVVTVPAGVAPADAEFLIVVVYDNGLAIGSTYNYDSGTLTSVF